MKDIFSHIHQLKRPPLLVRAARFGVDEYARDTHLRRLLKTEPLPPAGQALIQLMELERELDDKRIAAGGDYSVARHVELLIAIMGEAQILRATHRSDLVRSAT